MWQATSGAWARRTSPDGAVEGEELRPRRRGLERLDQDAAVHQLVAHVGAVEARAHPGAPRGLPERHAAGVAQRLGRRLAAHAHALLRPRPAHDGQRAARHPARAQVGPQRARAHAAQAGHADAQPGLVLVGEPRHVGRGAALLQAPQRLGARAEAREHPALVARQLGRRAHPQRHLGDGAQHALRAHDEPAQLRARGARRLRAQVEVAAGRRQPQPHHELVDAPVARRRLPGRARGRAAADRHVLIALRVVAEGEAALAQASLELDGAHPAADHGQLRALVQRVERVERPEVERHERAEALAQRLDPSRPRSSRRRRARPPPRRPRTPPGRRGPRRGRAA